MTKPLFIFAICFCYLFILTSCDFSLEDTSLDSESSNVLNDTENVIYGTSNEQAETDFDEDSSEAVIGYETEANSFEETGEETSAETGEDTAFAPESDETLPPLFDMNENPRLFLLVVELEGAYDCDMQQLTYFKAHKDGSTYSYTATLNHRAYRPGDTIEIVFSDLIYHGESIDVKDAVESGLLRVSMSDFCVVGSADENAFTWEEDGRVVFTVPQELAPEPDTEPAPEVPETPEDEAE